MSDIMSRRTRGFVLWRPARTVPAPAVRVATLVAGNPPAEVLVFEGPLRKHADFDDLWELPLAETLLVEGVVYHYWFVVTNDRPGEPNTSVRVTDPFARVVDYRLGGGIPAAVVKVVAGELRDCDPDGSVGASALSADLSRHAANNQLVIYEVPSSWTRGATESGLERDVGTFRDVLALLTEVEPGGNFSDVEAVAGRAHLLELGVNAIELLPPADSPFKREWGYATGNYCAADWDLGFPEGNASPTAEQDLKRLVARMHELGVRFFCDVVMAFGHSSYRGINFADFHIVPKDELGNADAYQSSRNGEVRQDFGGTVWRYIRQVEGYDPVRGVRATFAPAQRFHLVHLLRWLAELGVDALRIDSVNNIASWDFVREYAAQARAEYRRVYAGALGVDARFLSVGEELAVPIELVTSGRLDALWNETFKRRVRAVIRGLPSGGDNFEETVKKLVDCRRVGFQDGSQAINYVTSHDVGGFQNERLFRFLDNNGIGRKLERIQLAFACLMTAVGIPMIFAGEEFADEHDRILDDDKPDKQQDPVDFSRVNDAWRKQLFDYVARLVRFRIESRALGTNDTNFIHSDFSGGRRILAWVRGVPGREDPVVVVANFSDVQPPGSEYRVPNWPATPLGRHWREVSQARLVPDAWIGREPLFPWEAKVYALT